MRATTFGGKLEVASPHCAAWQQGCPDLHVCVGMPWVFLAWMLELGKGMSIRWSEYHRAWPRMQNITQTQILEQNLICNFKNVKPEGEVGEL